VWQKITFENIKELKRIERNLKMENKINIKEINNNSNTYKFIECMTYVHRTDNFNIPPIEIKLKYRNDISLSEKKEIVEKVIEDCVINNKVDEVIVNPTIYKYILMYYTNFNEVVDSENLSIDDYSILYNDYCLIDNSNNDIYEITSAGGLEDEIHMELKYIREKSYRSNTITKLAEELINSFMSIENKKEISDLLNGLISSD
jgi:hypothetical protein